MKQVCDLHSGVWIVCDCMCECPEAAKFPEAADDVHLQGCRYENGKHPGDRSVMVRKAK